MRKLHKNLLLLVYILSFNILFFNTSSFNILSTDVSASDVLSPNILSYDVLSTNILSPNILSFKILSSDILSSDIVSFKILSSDILSSSTLLFKNLLSKMFNFSPYTNLDFNVFLSKENSLALSADLEVQQIQGNANKDLSELASSIYSMTPPELSEYKSSLTQNQSSLGTNESNLFSSNNTSTFSSTIMPKSENSSTNISPKAFIKDSTINYAKDSTINYAKDSDTNYPTDYANIYPINSDENFPKNYVNNALLNSELPSQQKSTASSSSSSSTVVQKPENVPNNTYEETVSPKEVLTEREISVPIEVPKLSSLPSTLSKKVIGYSTYYYDGDQSSYNSLATNYKYINDIITHTYIMDKSGNLSGLLPKAQIDFAKNKAISVYAMVSNNFSGDIAKAVLESPFARSSLIANISNVLKTNGFKGVNIDIEGVYGSNRSHLTQFMKELYNTLKPLGFSVSISIPAKTSDSASQSWSYAYDYIELAKTADEVILMTYDEHYPGGSPGPVASINWVNNVLNYALTTIPNSKIILGVAAYGYDWSSKGTKAFSISQAYSTASKYGTEVKWDSTSQTPYYNYTDEVGLAHSVWFENANSLNFKIDLVTSKNIVGIAIWRLGLENGDYWQVINSKLN